MGSWNTTVMSLPLISLHLSSSSRLRSSPSKYMWPLTTLPGGLRRPAMAMASVVLPLPDSPIMATTSPLSTVNVASSTALTVPWGRS